jgi:CheY-like chemotaxis protein
MPSASLSPKPVTILMAEDDLSDATLALRAFQDCEIPTEIFRVKDGEEAISYLKKESPYGGAVSPDLILLDLKMPKVDGLEVLQEIRNNPAWKETPVLILTGSKADEDIQRAYEYKANFYIVKPTELDAFFGVMKYVERFWLSRLRP